MNSQSTHVVCRHCTTVNRVVQERMGEQARCGRCKQALFTGKPVTLNDDNFDLHVSKSDVPIVVDFWAPWCGPCRMMAPAFEQAAGALEPGVQLAKLNTEEARRTASRFGIRSIPTLAIFRGGSEIARQSGAMDYATLTRWIRSQLC
jgi:thioredoxin 2